MFSQHIREKLQCFMETPDGQEIFLKARFHFFHAIFRVSSQSNLIMGLPRVVQVMHREERQSPYVFLNRKVVRFLEVKRQNREGMLFGQSWHLSLLGGGGYFTWGTDGIWLPQRSPLHWFYLTAKPISHGNLEGSQASFFSASVFLGMIQAS